MPDLSQKTADSKWPSVCFKLRLHLTNADRKSRGMAEQLMIWSKGSAEFKGIGWPSSCLWLNASGRCG